MNNNKEQVGSRLYLTTLLTTSISIVISTSYLVLSLLGIIYRFDCDLGPTNGLDGSKYFLNILFRVYIQKDDCNSSITYEGLTEADSVFLLNIITLCASALCLVAAVGLLVVLLSEDAAQKLYLAVVVYICVYVASFVVDLTFGIHFGMDVTHMAGVLNNFDAGMAANYLPEMVRLSALLLMTIALKGFVVHCLNMALIIMLIVYLIDHQNQLKKNEHPIHKRGAINAYDQPRGREDPWQREPPIFLGNNNRGPQINPAFVDDSSTYSRPPMRDNMTDTMYSRSESWQAPVQNNRPFSYLEEPRRPIPVKTPSSPSVDPSWRRERDWSAPPVPAPDYSPPGNRRLKSALKPSYM